ncbi:MAG: hypothetical protein PHX21_05300 [bacterium]|nr:hypothetical protein [bacterium]
MLINKESILDKGKLLLPGHVEIELPDNIEEVKQRRELLLKKYYEILGAFPKKGKLQIKELYRRRFSEHTEIKLTYQVEPNDIVYAYLLVPRNGNPPFPGIVAHHQCFIDCDLGKEAVVGKVTDRPDQVYGLELVKKGFVVLAPDSKNCGERFIDGLREEGDAVHTEEWKNKHCWNDLLRLNTKHFYAKHTYDSIAAIDCLVSFKDLVIPDKIGMIGHSLGAGTTFWTAALDERVKVAVTSCHYLGGMDSRGWASLYPQKPDVKNIWFHELLELIAPRALFATRGEKEGFQGGFQTREQDLAVQQWAFNYGKYICKLNGVDENSIQTRIFDGVHEFPKEIRQESYDFIKNYI